MSHFKLNITTIPNYNDGSFYLYKIKQDNSVFPYERIELLDSNPFSIKNYHLVMMLFLRMKIGKERLNIKSEYHKIGV